MKVVLLAAGRSFRMAPIADKNFLKFFGKPLILHQIEALKKAGFKDILVIVGKHNMAQLRLVTLSLSPRRVGRGDPDITSGSKGTIKVREQKNLELGMAGAVLTAKSWIGKDPFLLVSANDIIEPSAFELLRKNIKKGDGILLAKKVSSYFPGGYLKVNSRGVISKIVEKPKPGREPSKLVNLVIHYHPNPKLLFDTLNTQYSLLNTADNLYEQALQSLFNRGTSYRALPYNGFWQPLKYPWHVLNLMHHFLQITNYKLQITRKVKIAKSAKIYGNVYLEDGVRVFDNAVIQGPAYIGRNTVIATNALVRQSHIGENCVIGFGSEVARSFVGDNVWTHTNYIGDSIIGNNVSFGAGTVTGNLRLDEKSVKVTVAKKWNGKVEEERVDSGTTKLGLITGDNIRVGINTSFMPGVKVGSNSFVGAGIVVAEDIAEGSFIRGEWKLKVGRNSEKISPRGGLR